MLLGATGSIGKSCARVILDNPRRFSVEAVVGGRDGAALARTAIELDAKFAAIADPSGYAELKAGLAGRRIEIACGAEAMEAAARWPADLVVSAIVGAVGLKPTFAAIECGRVIALANKETLVCAGAPVMRAVQRYGATLLPLDSEHNAIFQALGGRDPSEVTCMTITASGGPFREWSAERIAKATRAEALAHPKWSMGPKISVDSASLMNKGLELIEAHHLFAISPDKLAVVVHPQSIVHGLIAFADGSTIAGLANPDMRTAGRALPGLSRSRAERRRGARSHRAVELTFEAGRSRTLSGAAHRARGARRRGRGADRAQRRQRNRRRRVSRRPDRLRRAGRASSSARSKRCARPANYRRPPTSPRRWQFTMSREIGPPPSWPDRVAAP